MTLNDPNHESCTRPYPDNRQGSHPGCAGFTLVEIALAALVIGLGILTLFGLSRLAARSASEAQDETRAAIFSENVFASLGAVSEQLNAVSDSNAWERFWIDLRSGNTNVPDAAWAMWGETGDPSELWIYGDNREHTNTYCSFAPGRPDSPQPTTEEGLPEFAVIYRMNVAMTNAAPSLGTRSSRAEVTLHVWSGRYRQRLEPSTFYTHYLNHGILP